MFFSFNKYCVNTVKRYTLLIIGMECNRYQCYERNEMFSTWLYIVLVKVDYEKSWSAKYRINWVSKTESIRDTQMLAYETFNWKKKYYRIVWKKTINQSPCVPYNCKLFSFSTYYVSTCKNVREYIHCKCQ